METNKNKCDLCKKDRKNFEGCVLFSEIMTETHLCRSCYLKWCKEHKSYGNKHRKIKPLTKDWNKMCDEEARLFKKWFKLNSNGKFE